MCLPTETADTACTNEMVHQLQQSTCIAVGMELDFKPRHSIDQSKFKLGHKKIAAFHARLWMKPTPQLS